MTPSSRETPRTSRPNRESRAVFFDRDGTLIEDVGYLNRVEDVRILPGAIDAVRILGRRGYRVIVVTNQSAVARGMLSQEGLSIIHDFIGQKFAEAGAGILRFYYCPHHPRAKVSEFRKDCKCRKPKPGLILKSASDLRIDLSRSWMVGDSPRDVVAGKTAGCRAILIGAAAWLEDLPPGLPVDKRPDHVARDVLSAAEWILREGS